MRSKLIRNTYAALLFLLLAAAATALAGAHDLVVIRPGGPPANDQAQQQVDRLIKQIAAAIGWPSASATARYFNATTEGFNYIKQARPAFMLGTPGFYLKYRKQLLLKPINQVILPEGNSSRYYVVVKKGTAASLADLRGKTLAGAHLAEPEYIERIVLNGALKFGTDVTIQPMSGLSALRKLDMGQVFAVVIDAKENKSLASLPFAGDLAVIFTSQAIPNTGMMAVGANASTADIAALQKAAANLCQSEAGKGICAAFEINGFAPVAENVFADLIKQYGE